MIVARVSAHNLGQIGVKRDRATEVCFLHIARSDGEAEPHGVARKATSDDCPDGQCRSRMRRQDGLNCEHLQKTEPPVSGDSVVKEKSVLSKSLAYPINLRAFLL